MPFDVTVRPLRVGAPTSRGVNTYVAEVDGTAGACAQILVGTPADVARRLAPNRVRFEERPDAP